MSTKRKESLPLECIVKVKQPGDNAEPLENFKQKSYMIRSVFRTHDFKTSKEDGLGKVTVRLVKDYSSGPVALIRAVTAEMEKKVQIWRQTQPDLATDWI